MSIKIRSAKLTSVLLLTFIISEVWSAEPLKMEESVVSHPVYFWLHT